MLEVVKCSRQSRVARSSFFLQLFRLYLIKVFGHQETKTPLSPQLERASFVRNNFYMLLYNGKYNYLLDYRRHSSGSNKF